MDKFISLKQFTILNIISHGAYGIVNKASINETNKIVVLKIVNLNELNTKLQEISCNEGSIIEMFNHPNIIKCYGYFTEKIDNVNYYVTVLEYIPGNDLYNVVIKNEKFSECVASNIIRQLLTTVKYCHNMGVMHRDIKPENIMVLKNTKNNPTIKLIDFGLSTIEKEQTILLGTLAYLSPEEIHIHEENYKYGTSYSESIDTWGIGIIAYILIEGSNPFQPSYLDIKNNPEKTSNDIIIENIFNKKIKFWNTSKLASEFINGLLTKNPKDRLKLDDALSHPWISEYYEPPIKKCKYKSPAK